MILIRYFDRDYTVEQLDRGDEINFHPCRDGANPMGFRSPWKFGPADRPRYYDEERHEFYYPGGGCSMSPSYMPRTSDGTDKRKGDPYPSHWLFDPFTGEFLRGFDRDYTVDELDRGEGMKFHPCANDHGSRYVFLPFEPGVDRFHDGKHHYHWIVGYDLQQQRFRTKREHLARISDGKDVKKGDPYPEHWMTDPFTGEWLKDAGVE